MFDFWHISFYEKTFYPRARITLCDQTADQTQRFGIFFSTMVDKGFQVFQWNHIVVNLTCITNITTAIID